MTKFTGSELKKVRKFLGLEQHELASLIGSYQNTISKAERQENKYISDRLNEKVNKGLKENDIDPEMLFMLIDEFESIVKSKFKGEVE